MTDAELLPADVIRQSLAAGRCPWCGGIYQEMGQHTNPKHGVRASELRNLALLLRRQPTCSADLSAYLTEKRQEALIEGRAYVPDSHLSYTGKPHEFTKAGLEVARRLAQHARSQKFLGTAEEDDNGNAS